LIILEKLGDKDIKTLVEELKINIKISKFIKIKVYCTVASSNIIRNNIQI
jgi:hypothetical protein